MKTYNPSSIEIVKKTKETKTNTIGVKQISLIPVNKPAVVIFGGDKTTPKKNINWYTSRIGELLLENDIKNVDVYSLLYNFGSRDPELDRIKLFLDAGRKIKLNIRKEVKLNKISNQEPDPLFIQQLFDILILPRILDKNGKILDTDSVINNVRKLVIFAHCHGTYVAKKFEKLMYKKMIDFGYSSKAVKNIQKNLLVIAHAPFSPIENSNFNTIYFISADDDIVTTHYNNFSQYISKNSDKLVPCFFPNDNIFIAKQLKNLIFEEHLPTGLLKSERSHNDLTDNGEIIFAAERNAIINGVKNSVKGEPIPSVSELVSGEGVDFKKLFDNGESFYRTTVSDLRFMKRNPKHVNQK